MIIDRTQRRWMVAILILTVGLSFGYLLSNLSGSSSGGTVLGLVYGSLALAILLFASLLGVRKKVPAWRVGRASAWLKGHLWLSLLLIPLVCFHSAFEWGGGLTGAIWIFFILATLSGVVGIVVQQFLPRLMMEQVPMETIYDQIDHVLNQIRYETDLEMTQCVGPLGVELAVPEGTTPPKVKEGAARPEGELLKKFYLEVIRPALDPKMRSSPILASRTRIETLFAEARLSVAPEFHPTLSTLAERTEERRQLERQRQFHRWLHGWLFVHMPASVVLLLLVLVHVISVIWY